jgi:uncharacterized membrane protein YwaF
MWSPFHLLFIASPFIATLILQLTVRRKSFETKRRIGFWLAVACVVILFLRNAEILVKNDWEINAEVIPLQICHFANFVLLWAFWKNDRVTFALAYCLNLPAALMSILFANSLENYTTLLTFRAQAYLWGHMLIVATTLFAFLNGFVRIDGKTFGRTALLMLGLYAGGLVISNVLNAVFGFSANYFYALRPEGGTPLELFYDWGTTYSLGFFQINPVYLMLTAAVGATVVSAFYGLYRVVSRRLPVVD